VKGKIIFNENWFGEKEQIIDDLVEVHYCFPSFEPRTAFEQRTTGQVISNKYIKEFEIKENINDDLIQYLLRRINELSILERRKTREILNVSLEDAIKKGTFQSMSSLMALAEANEYNLKIRVFTEEIEKLKKMIDE
jgi:hypothetical protein